MAREVRTYIQEGSLRKAVVDIGGELVLGKAADPDLTLIRERR